MIDARTRFAPSPTGYLHLGHARAAFEAFKNKDEIPCLLRIEDIDHTRCRPYYTDCIYEDLHWLGFDWPKPVRLQNPLKPRYLETVSVLKAKGLVYPCQKTRAEIDLASPRRNAEGHPLYDGPTPAVAQTQWRRSQPATWRLSIQACRAALGPAIDDLRYIETGPANPLGKGEIKVDINAFGDGTLIRRDIGSSYHLAVTHDDAAQGITHVIRGADLSGVTAIHCLLQTLMGWPRPIYHHHTLLRREDGEKLSKRNQDTSIRSLRDRGHSPEAVLDMAFERTER